MPSPLNVAFLWHMHQPYYRDPATDKYALPWVRLHGIKGYTDMLEAVSRFGGEQVTFNLVPCLVQQLTDIAYGGDTDIYYDLSVKSPEDLTTSEKKVIIRHFFSANYSTLIRPYPRYRDLLRRRGNIDTDEKLEAACRNFSNKDLLDLQMWFNLTWFGWAAQEKHSEIIEYKKKDRNFTGGEKEDILKLQIDVLKAIIPNYNSAWQKQTIDISTTPFYHPILPLVIDIKSASISQPGDPMPCCEFQRPDDAAEQLNRGRQYMFDIFGQFSTGLWPSEGSISPAVCELVRDAGFSWLGSDESVLFATLQGVKRKEALYLQYLVSQDGPAIVFRDKFLSDAIGFRYSGNTTKNAVDDFMGHLEAIAKSLPQAGEGLVTIILDGENAWEYFPDGGRNFFEELYQRINEHKSIKLTTIGDYIQRCPAEKVLPSIFPASWINGSFRIWIGDPLKNRAWEMLADAAETIEMQSKITSEKGNVEKAKEWLFRAEGSDWFWWYGTPNSSGFDREFDYLFRANVAKIYEELGLDVPELVSEPIAEKEQQEQVVLFLINPVIDGRQSNFYEWTGAQVIESGDFSGSMNFGSSLIEKIHFGFSRSSLFIRLDPTDHFNNAETSEVIVLFSADIEASISIRNLNERDDIIANWQSSVPPKKAFEVAFDEILELKMPFANFHQHSEKIKFAIVIKQENLDMERWPREGYYNCPYPTEEYLTTNWII